MDKCLQPDGPLVYLLTEAASYYPMSVSFLGQVCHRDEDTVHALKLPVTVKVGSPLDSTLLS